MLVELELADIETLLELARNEEDILRETRREVEQSELAHHDEYIEQLVKLINKLLEAL